MPRYDQDVTNADLQRLSRFDSIARPGDIVDPPRAGGSRKAPVAAPPTPAQDTGEDDDWNWGNAPAKSNPLMDPSLWGKRQPVAQGAVKDDGEELDWGAGPGKPAPGSGRSEVDELNASFPKEAKASPSGHGQPGGRPSLDDLWDDDAETAKPSASNRRPPTEPVSTGYDVAKSAASGVRSGVEGLLGLPGAATSARDWLVQKALEKVGGATPEQAAAATNKWFGWSDMPTASDIHEKFNSWGVPDYAPQTKAGEYAHSVAEFVPGLATIPVGGEGILGSLAGNAAKYAVVPGVASQAAGDLFKGTPAEPWVRVVAGMAGGFGAEAAAQAGRGAYGAAKQFVEPLTEAGRQNYAARTFQNLFTDPDAAKNALRLAREIQAPDRGLGENVPGSRPTTGQLTGDMGALAAEKEMATRDPAFSKSNPFGTGAEQQNAARTAALEGVQPTGAPEAVGQAVRDRLAQIEAEHDANHTAALQKAQVAASGIGSGLTPEAVGANLRDALQFGRDAAKANERKLWAAVDPDGTLAMPATPISDAASKVTGSIAKTAKPLAGEEAAIFNTAQNLPAVAPFHDITALRSRISTAMREELRTSGQTPSYARLAQLRDSVEGAISGAVENRAAAEAKSVAQGAMDPEATMEARLQAQANEFQRTRAAAAGTNLSQGVAGDRGSGPSDIPGARGTERQASGGFGNPAGDQGVSHTPNLDEAAAQRLKAASAATKDRAETFKSGPVGAILKPGEQQPGYNLRDALVPGRVFAPGPAGAQTVAAYRKAAGPQGEAVLHDAASQSLNHEAVRDGILDPKKYQSWAAKHQDALRALPDALKTKFANAASASDALAEAAVTRKAALDHYQKSAAGKLLKLSDPQDITRTVGGIFEARNGVQRMSQLAATVADIPDAREGLRKAVADYILSKAKGTTEAGTSGVENLNAGRFQTLIRNNARTLKAAGFSDEEVGLMHAIGEDMQRSQRTLQATRLPGQSNTAQDLLKHIDAGSQTRGLSLMGKLLAGAFGGWELGGAHGAAYGALSGAGQHVVHIARNAGIANASAMVRDAMFNPELARALLEKAPAQVGAGSYANLKRALGRMATFSGETPSRDDRQHRARGGSVKRKLNHEQLVQRLLDASEEAKAATKKATKRILSVPDDFVARALAAANKAI